MHLSTAIATTLLLATSSAKIIVIDAGKDGLTYTPSSSTAEIGDTLEFHFFNSFHTAIQGDFDSPCDMGSLNDVGFNSGPIKNAADGSGSVFQVPIKDTNPIYFYCGTPTHCQSGMVGAINAPASGNTLEAYKSAAADTSASQLKPDVQGGVVVPLGTNPSGASSSAAVSSSAAASSSSAASSVSPSATFSVAATSPKTSAAGGSTSVTKPSSSSTANPSPSTVPASGGAGSLASAGNYVLNGIVTGFGLLFAFA